MYLDKPDALSSVITHLELTAEVYVNGDFCGTWAVDTSGSRRIPFHLIANGDAWLHNEGQPAIHLTPGSLVVFPNDSQHLMASSDAVPDDLVINQLDTRTEENPTQMICGFFEFKNKSAWPLLDSLSPVILIELGESSEEVRARNLVEQLLYELKNEAPGHYVVVNQLAYLLFIEVMRQQIKTEKVKSGILSALFDPKISKALAAIHSHPEKRWTLEGMAEKAMMGRSSFSSKFTELVGVPAMQYLTSWRMQHATALLRTTDQPMWHIAEQCGYESDAAFQKAFKKTVGETPGRIRRNQRIQKT